MSRRLGLSVVAVSFLFSQTPSVAGGSTTSAVRNLATSSSGHDDISARIARAGLAPVGHRQPRPSDVSETAQSSSSDLELRRLDQEIDRKLIICRGC